MDADFVLSTLGILVEGRWPLELVSVETAAAAANDDDADDDDDDDPSEEEETPSTDADTMLSRLFSMLVVAAMGVNICAAADDKDDG